MALTNLSLRALSIWFSTKVKPFLEHEDPDKVAELKREITRLVEREKQLAEPLSVCFVGDAGVGKSTLINAMVAGGGIVVPSGGVGPLTAQAIQISYNELPSFSAIYHSPSSFWKIGFALESAIRRDEKSSDAEDDADLTELLDDETREEMKLPVDGQETENKTETYRKQAQLILTGNQENVVELKYLADSIREAIGKPRKWKTKATPEDQVRINRLKKIFETEHKRSESIFELDGNSAQFTEELHVHAAGYLSPIIKELQVRWNSPLLKEGIQLVDLPGLGIAGDVYREVADKWVRNNANAVVLVVNHRGITEADANLLRSSGYLTRLLHSADDPTADPVILIVAVVRTDEIASTLRQNDVKKTKATREYLADVMSKCRELVNRQLQEQIATAWTNAEDELGEVKKATIDRIAETLQVFPLSTTQYRLLLIDDEDERPFIREEEQSGVPAMVHGLATLCRENREVVHERFSDALNSLYERLLSQVELIRARWEEKTRAREEADALKAELESFIKPLREEFRARQGGYRAFLKETLPANIETVVVNSSLTATKSIRSYLRKLRDANWRTLQAAVKRDGTFYGARHINLPTDFAMSFEDPVAEAWGKSILSELRKRTREFSADCLGFVDRVVEWAKEQGGRVQPRLIEAQRDAIAADTKHLASVGKSVVDDLRETVRAELCKAIEGPIRRKCQAFVRRNEHVGTGVRNRILDLFDDLADEAIEAAKTPAQNVLLSNYRLVESEILEAWKNHNDPLLAAAEAIVSSHEDSVKRSDAQKRKKVLDEIDDIIQCAPAVESTASESAAV
ncbi:MAG: dynamin family protein [Pirellulaceae bacterium]|nr:dynamin family protein [Pirellulaceae bacterium]